MGQEICTGSERFLQRVMFSHIYIDIYRFSDNLFLQFRIRVQQTDGAGCTHFAVCDI